MPQPDRDLRTQLDAVRAEEIPERLVLLARTLQLCLDEARRLR